MPILFCSVKELKERTPKVLKDVEEADIVVTLHGKPRAILRRFTEQELGDAIARSEEIRKGLTAAVEDLRAGRTIPTSELQTGHTTRVAARPRRVVGKGAAGRR